MSAVRCLISDVWCLKTVVCTSVCLSVCLWDIYLSDDWYLTSAVLRLLRCLLSVAWRLVISSVRCQLFIVWCLLFAVCIFLICYVRYLLAAVFCLMPLIWCWMSAVCMSFDNYLMSTICCLLSDVSYLMPDVYCLSPAVWCLLSAVSVSFDIFCLLSAICCLMPAVWYPLPAVYCLCLLSGVCCLYVSWLWCLLHTCLMSDVKSREILPVIRPFISHRILLSYKESHLMKTGSIGVSG